MEQPRLSILVVTAHPHDFTHCAGTLGVHVSQGDKVTVVSMTQGGLIHNEDLSDELRKPQLERNLAVIKKATSEYGEVKVAELRAACALFGIRDVRVLNMPEPFRLGRCPESVDELRNIFLEIRPQILIAQRPTPYSPRRILDGVPEDHSEVAYATLEARNQARTGRTEDLKPPHITAVTLFPGVYFEYLEHDFAVDISAWYEQRVLAEIAFKSQGHTEAFARRRIQVAVGSAGWQYSAMYAEGFVRDRPELQSSITVSELTLRHASESETAHIQRVSGVPVTANSLI